MSKKNFTPEQIEHHWWLAKGNMTALLRDIVLGIKGGEHHLAYVSLEPQLYYPSWKKKLYKRCPNDEIVCTQVGASSRWPVVLMSALLATHRGAFGKLSNSPLTSLSVRRQQKPFLLEEHDMWPLAWKRTTKTDKQIADFMRELPHPKRVARMGRTTTHFKSMTIFNATVQNLISASGDLDMDDCHPKI